MYTSSSKNFKSYQSSNDRVGVRDTASSVSKLTSNSRSRSVDDLGSRYRVGSSQNVGGGEVGESSLHATRGGAVGVGSSASASDRRFKTMARDYKSYRDSNDTTATKYGASSLTTQQQEDCDSHHCQDTKTVGGGNSSYSRGRTTTKDLPVITKAIGRDTLVVEEAGADRRTSKNQYRITGRITRSPSPADASKYRTTTTTSQHYNSSGVADTGLGGEVKSSSKYLTNSGITGASSSHLTGNAGIKGGLTRDGISILGGSSKGYPAEEFNSRSTRNDDGLFVAGSTGAVGGGTSYGNGRGASGYLPQSGAERGGGRTDPKHDLQLPHVRRSTGGANGAPHTHYGREMNQGSGGDRNRFIPLNSSGRGAIPNSGGYQREGRPRNNSNDRHISPERSYDDGAASRSHRPVYRQRSRGRLPAPSDRRRSTRRPTVRRSRSMNDLLGGRRSPSPQKHAGGGGGGGNVDLNDSFPVCKRFPNCSVCVINIPLKQQQQQQHSVRYSTFVTSLVSFFVCFTCGTYIPLKFLALNLTFSFFLSLFFLVVWFFFCGFVTALYP